jgi:hypothetical protein
MLRYDSDVCEPAHSIVQFEPPDDSSPPPSDGGTTPSGWKGWLKKFGGLFHLSRMGNGHSESLTFHRDQLCADMNVAEPNLIYKKAPPFLVKPLAYYETNWWERKLVLDGYGCNATDPIKIQESFDAAQQYASHVCLGSLHAFREFLGTSIMKSGDPISYALNFRTMLNKRGRREYEHRIKVGKIETTYFKLNIIKDMTKCRDGLRRLCLGFTRKRHLLVPEWADDASLWTPI